MNHFHDFVMELLLWKKGTSGHDYAIACTYQGVFLGCARANLDARPITGTAVVNLLQSALANNRDLNRAWIYSTAVPTEACKGMARLQTRGGKIFYEATGLKCYLADRQNPGLVQVSGWALSSRADLWSALARGGRTRAVWFDAVKGATLARRNYVPQANLADDAAQAATDVENLAVWTGRAANTLTPFFDPEAAGSFEIVRQLPNDTARDAFFSLLAQELVYRLRGRVAVDSIKSGHNIGSVVVDKAWKLVGWGVNTNKLNGSFHGETNTVQALESHGETSLPAGGTMYTSLEPCEMCAGVIREAVADGDDAFRVIYIQADKTLSDTALTDDDSPVTMTPATVANDQTAHAFVSGRSYGAELDRRQKALDDAEIAYARDYNRGRQPKYQIEPDRRYLAPTTFLRHQDAVSVFGQAQAQRERLSTPLARQMAAANVRTEGKTAAIDDQGIQRAYIHRQLRSDPWADNREALVALGSRDDTALLEANSRQARDRFALQSRMDALEANRGRILGGRGTGVTRDDSYLQMRGRRIQDPHLMQMAIMLDNLSVKFRTFFEGWMAANERTRTAQENTRLLRQVSDFLDRAALACLN